MWPIYLKCLPTAGVRGGGAHRPISLQRTARPVPRKPRRRCKHAHKHKHTHTHSQAQVMQTSAALRARTLHWCVGLSSSAGRPTAGSLLSSVTGSASRLYYGARGNCAASLRAFSWPARAGPLRKGSGGGEEGLSGWGFDAPCQACSTHETGVRPVKRETGGVVSVYLK